MSSLIEAKFLSRLLSACGHAAIKTVQSKLFSLRIQAFHYAIGVYDKRVPGFEHQLPGRNAAV